MEELTSLSFELPPALASLSFELPPALASLSFELPPALASLSFELPPALAGGKQYSNHIGLSQIVIYYLCYLEIFEIQIFQSFYHIQFERILLHDVFPDLLCNFLLCLSLTQKQRLQNTHPAIQIFL